MNKDVSADLPVGTMLNYLAYKLPKEYFSVLDKLMHIYPASQVSRSACPETAKDTSRRVRCAEKLRLLSSILVFTGCVLFVFLCARAHAYV